MAQSDESQFQLFWVDVWSRILWAMYSNWQVNMQADCISIMMWSHLIIGLGYFWLISATLHCFITICHPFIDSIYLNNNEIFHLLIGPKLSRIGFRNILETFDKWCNHNICMTWADSYRTLQQGLFACNNKWQKAVDSYQDDMTQYLSRDFLTIHGINTTSICCISLG